MILLTGGSGTLGSRLRQMIDCVAPPRSGFDILQRSFPRGIDFIVHCAAYTSVDGAEKNMRAAYETNVLGTRNLSRYPIVYISTEYVFSGERGNYLEDDDRLPVNFYGFTKLCGELEVERAPSSMILRLLFKPCPFPHQNAVTDQWTSGDYVDVMAEKVAKCIKWFSEGIMPRHSVLHLGTGRKSTFDLAKRTRDVDPITRADIRSVVLPMDTSLNTRKFDGIENGHRLRAT